MTFSVNSTGLADQSITITGRCTITAGGIALGGLFRSSGNSTATALDDVDLLATAPASLRVHAWLAQLGRADSLEAVAVRDSELRLGDANDTTRIRASVLATGARALAVGLDRSGLFVSDGGDVVTVSADITGCAAPGSQAVALRDSWVGLGGSADRITVSASGPGALWGQRAAIRGREGSDTITCWGDAEDVIVNGFQGDDTISLHGRVRSTDPATPSRIGGGPGFDVLALGHLTGAQFTSLMRPDAGPERGFRLGADETRYLQFEQVVCGDGARFDLVGMGVA